MNKNQLKEELEKSIAYLKGLPETKENAIEFIQHAGHIKSIIDDFNSNLDLKDKVNIANLDHTLNQEVEILAEKLKKYESKKNIEEYLYFVKETLIYSINHSIHSINSKQK